MKKKFLNTTIIIALCAIAQLGLSQNSNALQYTVIHLGANGLEVHETTVDDSVELSIEEYISSLGYESENSDIINISSGAEFVSSDSGIWLMNDDGNGGTQTIELQMDGDDVDLTMEEVILNMDVEGEQQQYTFKSVIVIDDETENTGDVDIEELIEGSEGENVFIEEGEMDVRVEKFIDEEGNEITQMWVNGEEVDAETYEGNLQMFEFDGESENEFIFINEGDSSEGSFKGSDMEFTIGIVAAVETEENKSMETSTNIENLSLNPRSQDEYELSFHSNEAAKTEIILYDIQGREVMNKSLGNFQGEYRDTISVGKLNSGTYVLNIIQNGERVIKKILVN